MFKNAVDETVTAGSIALEPFEMLPLKKWVGIIGLRESFNVIEYDTGRLGVKFSNLGKPLFRLGSIKNLKQA